jgi:chloramphenicol-sensitive protein RarD
VSDPSRLDPANDGAERHGIIAAVAAYLVWGALTIYWRQLHSFNAVELIGWRVICSAALMAVVLTVTGRWQHLAPIRDDRRLLGTVVLSAVVLATNWTTYVWAVVHDHVLETALGYFLSPLGTMAVGVLVLHEPVRRMQQVVFGLAVVAVMILTFSYGRVPWLALLIAATWVLYGYLKKGVPLTPVESMAAESFVVMIPAIAAVVVLSGTASSIAHSGTTIQVVLVAGSGLATIIPLTLFAFAAQRVPLTIIGPLNYIVPTINFCLGRVAFHEALPPARMAGFVLIWIGLLIAGIDAARRSRTRVTPLEAMPV